MASKQDCRDALVLALERGIAGKPEDGLWRFYNASPLPGLGGHWKKALLCQQGFRPEYLHLKQCGYSVVSQFSGKEPSTLGAIFLLGRNREWNEYMLSHIWNRYGPSGRLIVVGDKTSGIGSIRKWFGSQVTISDAFAKFHSVVFWADRHYSNPDLPRPFGFSMPFPPGKFFDGYMTRAGMFSSDRPDAGSLLLVEHFDERIRGKIADLGAGWGYLSGELLKRSEQIEEIDLFEAGWESLQAAEGNLCNLPNAESRYHWIDVTTEFPKKPYDWVIMNPPFHSAGRAAEPALGQKFIDVAASTLPSGGKFLMVANKNLPYEKTLETKFRRFEKLAERNGFKVFEAVK